MITLVIHCSYFQIKCYCCNTRKIPSKGWDEMNGNSQAVDVRLVLRMSLLPHNSIAARCSCLPAGSGTRKSQHLSTGNCIFVISCIINKPQTHGSYFPRWIWPTSAHRRKSTTSNSVHMLGTDKNTWTHFSVCKAFCFLSARKLDFEWNIISAT